MRISLGQCRALTVMARRAAELLRWMLLEELIHARMRGKRLWRSGELGLVDTNVTGHTSVDTNYRIRELVRLIVGKHSLLHFDNTIPDRRQAFIQLGDFLRLALDWPRQ